MARTLATWPGVGFVLALAVSSGGAAAQDTVALDVRWFDVDGLRSVDSSGLAFWSDRLGEDRMSWLGEQAPVWTKIGAEAKYLLGIAGMHDRGSVATGFVDQWYIEEMLNLYNESYDALAVRLSADGEVVWRRQLGGPGPQSGSEIVALSSGGAVVLGNDRKWMKAWGLSPDGELVWERAFDGTDGAIAALPRDHIVVVGRKRISPDPELREDATLWLIGPTGELLVETTMQEDINPYGGGFGYLSFSVSVGASGIAAVAGVNAGLSDDKMTLAKFDLSGELQWLAPTAYDDCDAEPFVLSDGDVLHACAIPFQEGIPRRVILSRYSAADGSRSDLLAALPECQNTRTSAMIRVLGADDASVTLVGARPPGNVGKSCVWLGHMTLPVGQSD